MSTTNSPLLRIAILQHVVAFTPLAVGNAHRLSVVTAVWQNALHDYCGDFWRRCAAMAPSAEEPSGEEEALVDITKRCSGQDPWCDSCRLGLIPFVRAMLKQEQQEQQQSSSSSSEQIPLEHSPLLQRRMYLPSQERFNMFSPDDTCAAIHFAARSSKRISLLRWLLEVCPSLLTFPTRCGRTPLLLAVEMMQADVVALLITEYHADARSAVDLLPQFGRCTALHLAVECPGLRDPSAVEDDEDLIAACCEIIHLLVTVGRADVNAKNSERMPPLLTASMVASQCAEQCAIALLEAASRGGSKKININLYAETPWGTSALTEAAQNNHYNLVKAILERAAENAKSGDDDDDIEAPTLQEFVNHEWPGGGTALHSAVEGDAKDVIPLLLSAGADKTIRSRSDGKTAREMAVDRGFDVCAELLA